MQIQVRQATREDCPALMNLVRELAEFERAPGEVTVSDDHFRESGFGQNPVWWALVAETVDNPGPDGSRIVGFALWYIRYSTWKGQAMYLEDLLVTKDMRGKKIGQLLFDHLMEEARNRGLPRIVWQVLDWNEPAISFYKKYNARFEKEWLNCSIQL